MKYLLQRNELLCRKANGHLFNGIQLIQVYIYDENYVSGSFNSGTNRKDNFAIKENNKQIHRNLSQFNIAKGSHMMMSRYILELLKIQMHW